MRLLMFGGLLLFAAFARGATPPNLAAAPLPAAPLAAAPAAAAFDVERTEWRDPARGRNVPVKLVVPRAPGPHPVILFSHGLGATRDAYAYLGEAWARAGYVTVYLQHAGSEAAIFQKGVSRQQAMLAAVADWSVAEARPRDVRFALDHLSAEARAGTPLGRAVDLAHVGVAGHSFGAWTSLVLAGQRIAAGYADGPLYPVDAYADPRVRAALAMSPPVRRHHDGAPTYDDIYGSIAVPLMVMSGTRDLSPVGDQRPEERRIPFDHARAHEGELVTFRDGDHWIYSGRGFHKRMLDTDLRFQSVIAEASTRFWDAYLRGDRRARAWLRGGGLKERLGFLGWLDVKR